MNTLPKALRKGFITDLKGNNVIEFQFNPTEFEFQESNVFNERNLTGREDTDTLWVSGSPEKFTMELFIDRSIESRGNMTSSTDISGLVGSPDPMAGNATAQYGRYVFDKARNVINEVKGIKREFDGNNIVFSDYNPSPHININDEGFDDDIGVWNEYNKFRKYLKPEGWRQADLRQIQANNGNAIIDRQFIPPPVAILYFGDLWVQGYMETLNPRFSVMNRMLVPQRMEITFSMTVQNKGILSPVNNAVTTSVTSRTATYEKTVS